MRKGFLMVWMLITIFYGLIKPADPMAWFIGALAGVTLAFPIAVIWQLMG